MAAGSRRLARLFLAPLAIGMAVSIGASDVQAATSPLSITAHLGYSDTVKAQQWMPISIAVTNNGPEVDGTLEIQTVLSGRPGIAWPASYQRSLVLATGATKYFRSYLVEESAGLTVSIRVIENGRVLASQNAAGTRTATTLIGVLSDDSTALDDFAAVHPGGIAATVVHLGLADLVDSPIALRAFDLLVVDDFATEGLSASQRTAVTEFIQTGGSLLVGTGASWRRTVAGLPAELLPMQLADLTTLGSSPALGGLGGVQVATGSLNGGTAWLADGGQPLLAQRTVGSGTVTMAAFDWKQEPIPNWTGTDALLRQVLVRSTLGAQAQQGAASPLSGPMLGSFGGQGTSAYERSSTLIQVLGSLPALDLPSLTLTGVLVLLYVLLVGPINFFVLGALHRRALSWITLPLIAVLVAAAAYGGAILTKGQSVQTSQLSILHLIPGSDRAYQETYTGVLTPTRGDFAVGTGGGSVLVSPISSYNGFGAGGGSDIQVNLEDGTVSLPRMTAFTLRGFGTESMTAAPQLTGHLRLVNGQLTGSVENRSSTTFTDAVVIAGDGYQQLGPLPPGASVSIGFAPRIPTLTGGPPGTANIYPNYTFGSTPDSATDDRRTGETKTRIISLLQSSNSFKGLPSSNVVPLVVAWSLKSFQPVTVNGNFPRAQSTTAVAMTLPVEEIGAGVLPAGVVSGQIVDFEGDTLQGQGPPGTMVVQNGTITYRFAPTLAPGRHLSGAILSAVNPFFTKGSVGPSGGASSTKGEAWNWSTSMWVAIAYQDGGTTLLPDGVVNPGTGELRLRLTVTNGGFLTTGISLAGTVE